MNGYNFTVRARTVLLFAREESLKLNHEYVGTEHLLLGMIRDTDGVADRTLRNLNVNVAQLKQSVIDVVPKSARTDECEHGPYPRVELPYTSRAKKVLELAMGEARNLAHTYVGVEHLLLGLLQEGQGVGAQVLMQAGVQHETARVEILRLLGDPNSEPVDASSYTRRSATDDSNATSSSAPIVSVFMNLRHAMASTLRLFSRLSNRPSSI